MASGDLPAVGDNPHWTGCRCVVCGRGYPTRYAGFVCEDCGIDGILDAEYDLDALAARARADSGWFAGGPVPGMWRFADLLPVRPAAGHPGWDVVGVPPVSVPRLAAHLGLRALVLKDDTRLPSGSLKDRAAAVAVARAVQLGIDHIACASTGNAAASLAVMAARAGLRSTIFVPAAAPRAKLAQLLIHGAALVRVDSDYDHTFEYSLRQIDTHRWYSRNCAHNPLLVEGKKTAVLELVHAWTGLEGAKGAAPDVVMVPVGDGCIVSSVAKGLQQLHALGIIDRLPRVIGVQAAGAAPLARAWTACKTDPAAMTGPQILAAVTPVTPRTLADSISVGVPRNRVKAWRYVSGTCGAFLAVPDEAIGEAIGLLARLAGVFAEPSGAAALAGIPAARDVGLIADDDAVAVMVTGNGLKDIDAALGTVSVPDPVSPA